MDQFESYLQYQKEVAESKLKIINRFKKSVKPKLKRTSKIKIAKNVLNIAGRPLHVSEIIQLAKRDFEVELFARFQTDVGDLVLVDRVRI